MKVTRHALLVSLALAGASCAQTPDGVRGGLSTGFHVYETRQGSGVTRAPGGGLVDYDSGVTLRPDPQRLRELLGAAQGVDASLSRSELQALDTRIDEAEARLQRFEDLGPLVDELASYAESVQRFALEHREGTRLLESPSYREMLQRRQAIIDELASLAWIYVESVEFPDSGFSEFTDPLVLTDGQFAAYSVVKQSQVDVYGTMAVAPMGNVPRYDAEAVVTLLEQTQRSLNTEVLELEAAILKKAPKVQVEMEAHLMRGKQPLPVSITPYTIVEGVTRGKKSPRIGLPNADEQEKVQQGYALSRDVATAFNNVKDATSDEGSKKALFDALAKGLESAAQAVADSLLSSLSDTARLAAKDGSAAALQTKVAAVKAAAKPLEDRTQSLVDAVDALGDEDDPLRFLRSLTSIVAQLSPAPWKAEYGTLKQAVKDLADDVGTATGLAPDSVAIFAALEQAVEAGADEFEAALAGGPGAAELGALARSLYEVREVAKASKSWGDLQVGTITRRSFSLDEAGDGFVDLANSPADSGDRLAVEYKVIVDPDDADARKEHHGSAWVGVRKFGVYTTFKSQLIFYDRLGDGSSSYRAAPAVGYNVHYRPTTPSEFWVGFWDGFDPALGISASTPSFESGVDIAVGLQLTLFNDMLQAGYGYNVSVDDDEMMFYFGLDLIGAFQQLPTN